MDIQTPIILEIPVLIYKASVCCFFNGSAKRLGPVMKLVVCVLITPVLAVWPVAVVVGSLLGGLAYGFLGPMFGTFKAVEEGKTDQFIHCITVSKLQKVNYILLLFHLLEQGFCMIMLVRMELGTLFNGVLRLSGILEMYAYIHISQLWMTFGNKSRQRVYSRSGLLRTHS